MTVAYICGFNGFQQISLLKSIIDSNSKAEKNDVLSGDTGNVAGEMPHIFDESIAGADGTDVNIGSTCTSKEINNIKPVKLPEKCCYLTPVKIELINKDDILLTTWSSLYYLGKDQSLKFITGANIYNADGNSLKNNITPKALNSADIFVAETGEDHVLIQWSNKISGSSFYCLQQSTDSFDNLDCAHSLISSSSRKLCFAVGGMKTLALENDGKLYEILASEDKETGENQLNSFVTEPIGSSITGTLQLRAVDLNFKVQEVSCGKEHALLLSRGGMVLTYGLGSRGQLGHGTTDPLDIPHVVESLEPIRITAIAAGGWHSLALAETGDIYSWGWNESGQLGIALSPQYQEDSNCESRQCKQIPTCQVFPCLVGFPIDATILSISCGSRHSAAVSDIGHVWTWGWNGYGQLGLGHMQNCDHPSRCSSLLDSGAKATSVYCNSWTTIAYCKETS